MHLPPPIHGAAVVGKNIYESKLINNEFDCKYINLSASSEVKEVGKLGFKKVLFLFSSVFTVCITVLTEKPDLCYVTPSSWDWGFYRDFVIVMLLKLFRCKVVVHFHNKGVDAWTNRPFNKLLYKLFFKNAKVILLSEELYAEKQPYVKRSDLYLCPNGIVKTNNGNILNEIENKTVRFLFLSNMMEEKGVWILLDACRVLKEKGYSFICDFVGKWSDISEIDFNIKVENYNLTNVIRAHGSQYGAAKNTFFQNANIFVFPTYYHGEAFPMVLLEAMEFGLPCISTFEGGIPSIVLDGVTGVLIKQKNVFELTQAMSYMIENPKILKEMGVSGQKIFLEKFTFETFEKNFITILKDCI